MDSKNSTDISTVFDLGGPFFYALGLDTSLSQIFLSPINDRISTERGL